MISEIQFKGLLQRLSDVGPASDLMSLLASSTDWLDTGNLEALKAYVQGMRELYRLLGRVYAVRNIMQSLQLATEVHSFFELVSERVKANETEMA